MRIRRLVSSLMGHHLPPQSKEEWDVSYTAGEWDYLRQRDELARYNEILSRCHGLAGGRDGEASVLDMCCGEGILLDLLPSNSFSRYVGVDLSEVAIQRAKRKESERVSFVRGDVEQFETSERFSVIVFNECLYYFRDPIVLLERYERFLQPNGIIVVSMYQERPNQRQGIWNRIGIRYTIENETEIDSVKGFVWVVKAMRPNKTRK